MFDVGGTVHLLGAGEFERQLTGRLGYGQSLLARAPLRSLPTREALVVEAGTRIDDVARLVLDQLASASIEGVAVRFADGGLGIVPLAPIMEYLARRYATIAFRDPLTGLGNRRQLGNLIVAAAEDLTCSTVLFVINIDRFKDVNDAIGYQGGDVLLSQVAATLARVASDTTAAIRLGSDEFAVLVDDARRWPRPITAEELADQLAAIGSRLSRQLHGPYQVNGVSVTVEASIGCAHLPSHGTDPTTLLARADAAMRTARLHRTGVEVWRPDLTTAGTDDLQTLTELRKAVPAGHLRLHYQPLVGRRHRRDPGPLRRWCAGSTPAAAWYPLARSCRWPSAVT